MPSYPGAEQGFKPIEQQGHLLLSPQRYGQSVQGAPLEFYGTLKPGGLLVIAGIHGEESDTVMVLSRALRLLNSNPLSGVVLCANPDGNRMGVRGNSRGVDLNRNFPTQNWSKNPTYCRLTLESPRVTELSTGTQSASEPEVSCLIDLIRTHKPTRILSLHSPLSCIDALESPWSQHIADVFQLPLVPDIGYPTPGSLGTWCKEQQIECVTVEFPRLAAEILVQQFAAKIAQLLQEG